MEAFVAWKKTLGDAASEFPSEVSSKMSFLQSENSIGTVSENNARSGRHSQHPERPWQKKNEYSLQATELWVSEVSAAIPAVSAVICVSSVPGVDPLDTTA